jgi:GH15 family glucan-1,4-alpha-glucosidase
MSSLDLAVIGNANLGALVDRNGCVVWSCLPRFDGDPVFCALLNGDRVNDPSAELRPDTHGFFAVSVDEFARAEQSYVHNTAVLVTRLYDRHGSAVEITDFAPRFKQHGRFYRPIMIVRRLRPVIGTPRIRIRLRPASDYGAGRPVTTYGSNHVRYVMPRLTLRLTTDAPLPYVMEEIPFLLEDPCDLILGPDETLLRPIRETASEYEEKTVEYWREWVRYLSIPFEWQEAVIRAAITLKLCSFEETGAVIAAMTTSIPEAPESGRNWDYRYCWPRDAHFVVRALNGLGATRTMEEYLHYITNLVTTARNGHLQPVYGVLTESRLPEREVPSLPGYRGMGPVRVGNEAYRHVQNDVYGSVVMAATQIFFDERLSHGGTVRIFERLESVGDQAIKVYDKPDAGLWEYRTIAKVHTFSAVMCWVACDRLARIATRVGLEARARRWREEADRMHEDICARAWNADANCFAESFGGSDVDASLLLLHELRFLAADDPRFAGTVAAIERRLRRGKYMLRYAAPDDFGTPRNAFTVCTFWYIDALAALGRRDEARDLFENLLARRNHAGLLSEDIEIDTGELWGNFPQTYSLVGMISSAMRLSRSWEEAL